MKYISQRKSVALVHMAQNRLEIFSDFMFVKDNALCLMLFDSKYNIKQLYYTINRLKLRSRYKPRLKCLIVYFYNNNIIRTSLTAVMEYAWGLNFLDFTIISVNQMLDCQSSRLHYFNPFFRKHHMVSLNDSELFPDKLIDCNGFRVNVTRAHQIIKPSMVTISFTRTKSTLR